MENNAPPSPEFIALKFILSFISAGIRGIFYVYLISVSFMILLAVLISFSSLGGFDFVAFLMKTFQIAPLKFSYQGGIPQGILPITALIFSVAGYFGAKLLEWWQKRKLTRDDCAKLLPKLCIIANLASALITFFFSLAQKDTNVLNSFFGAAFSFISLSVFAAFALVAYVIAFMIDSIQLTPPKPNA